MIEIRARPGKQFLRTFDGQHGLLSEFYTKCRYLFSQCALFEKFYYWPSEVIEIKSKTENGEIRHKIRGYCNCLSAFCLEKQDPQKTHGDVAEFYDENGEFMGMSVYMGDGKYCSLPYHDYQNKPKQGL